jgi:hypothetical protein
MTTLLHPWARVLGVALAVTVALRALFFACSTWLWSKALVVDLNDITPWARWAMSERDGAEPYALFAIVLLGWAVTAAGVVAIGRLREPPRAAFVAALLATGIALAWRVPPKLPWPDVADQLSVRMLVVAASSLGAWLLARALPHRRAALVALAAALVPICFIPIGTGSRVDMAAVLAPALRLAHGFSPREVYLQYDLLPSLLALGWMKLGGSPLHFRVVGAISFYAMLLGVFVLATRLFRRPALAAPMLVSIVLVRIYGAMVEATALPQTTPMRLDLWLPLLAVAAGVGLQHALVGLTLGLLCFFSRSIGTLYAAAYAMALVADFLACRLAASGPERLPLRRDLLRAMRRAAPALALVASSFVASRIVFGSFASGALVMYRRYGLGMMRIGSGSFYWWILPLSCALGWLAFERRWIDARRGVDARRSQAALFAATLMAVVSIYFFGRSHEHNLINISAALLYCAFLGLDLAGEHPSEGTELTRAAFRAAPWLILAICACAYSGRVVAKVHAQVATLRDRRSVPPAVATDFQPLISCSEIAQAVGDERVFFMSINDYWYYERCGYVPPGYMQPLPLAMLQKPLMADLNGLLDQGYKIVVPRQDQDWGGMFTGFLAGLRYPAPTHTPNYNVYRRP